MKMQHQRGITLMALVITVIILIILAGITLNLTIGQNGIINKAMQAKENTIIASREEQNQLDKLWEEIENNNSGSSSDGSSSTNAKANHILLGYKAYSRGELLTGTMPNRGAVSHSLNAGESYTIPEGYHNGSGKVTAEDLASQTQATATAEDITEGKTAWVNGTKIIGTNTSSNGPVLLWTNSNVQAQETFTISCDWSKYDKIIVLFGHHWQLYSEAYRNIVCFDNLSEGKVGIFMSTEVNEVTYRTITFNTGSITMYAPTAHNWYSYNIPLKIWGMKTNMEFNTNF